MDSDAHGDNARYGSIPVTGMAQTSSNQFSNPSRFRSISRLSRAAIGFAVCLSVLAFVVGKQRRANDTYYNRFPQGFPNVHSRLDRFRLGKESFGLWDRPKTNSNTMPLHKNTQIAVSGSNGFFRSRTSCVDVEDFVVEEFVPTGKCSSSRRCRARVIVSKTGGEVTVKAGFYITAANERVSTVDRFTQKRVRAVNLGEARAWANALLARVSNRLSEVDCEIASDMIAEAIMDTKDDAANCSNVDDALCSQLETIKSCTVALSTGETEEQKQCRDFVASSPTVTSFDDMKNSPCKSVFIYNRVGMSVPFCTTTCPSSACTGGTHTVYASFYVQTNVRGSQPENCVSAALIPAYNTLYGTIPTCDNTPPGETFEETIVSLASYYEGSVPQELQNIATRYGCQVTYAFFVMDKPVKDYVAASCATI